MENRLFATGADPELARALRARGLVRAGELGRDVAAGMARVWENVLDWEHLPWLHSRYFASAELISRGATGWRARVGLVHPEGARTVVLEIAIERVASRYVSRTVEGPGAGTEIWTQLHPPGAERTRVCVEFWLPEPDPARAQRRGAGLARTYAELWDEDEGMMVARTRELAARVAADGAPEPVPLGPVEALRERIVRLGGRAFCLRRVDGEWMAHAARCPHMLGPLDGDVVADGEVRCPWHGYRFDLRSGRSSEGRRLRLALARVRIDARTGEAWLHPDASGIDTVEPGSPPGLEA